jgi:phosphoribosylglycinamide formyltransferase-1
VSGSGMPSLSLSSRVADVFVSFAPVPSPIVILASGSGTTLQAVLDLHVSGAVRVAALGVDRPGTGAEIRAEKAGVPVFSCPFTAYAERSAWDEALTDAVAGHEPGWVLLSGLKRLVGPPLLHRFPGRVLNMHPALLPSFPGLHAARDALAHGVKVTGTTLFLVDAGTDTGPIVAQRPVPVLDTDTESTLHERIKDAERALLTEWIPQIADRGLTVTGREVRLT